MQRREPDKRCFFAFPPWCVLSVVLLTDTLYRHASPRRVRGVTSGTKPGGHFHVFVPCSPGLAQRGIWKVVGDFAPLICGCRRHSSGEARGTTLSADKREHCSNSRALLVLSHLIVCAVNKRHV